MLVPVYQMDKTGFGKGRKTPCCTFDSKSVYFHFPGNRQISKTPNNSCIICYLK